MSAEIITPILSAVGAGIVSTLGTVKALNVHISYLREQLNKVEKATERAHERIDLIERAIK